MADYGTFYGRCFNEAGGFLPRKLSPPETAARRTPTSAPAPRFNEAGGFLPRKQHVLLAARPRHPRAASMRPGDFSPGNLPTIKYLKRFWEMASMRPGDFSPGNSQISSSDHGCGSERGFNEAGGFLPRKHAVGIWTVGVGHRMLQ